MTAARSLPFGERVAALTARLRARPRKAHEEPRSLTNGPVPRRRALQCFDCARASRLERAVCRYCGGRMVPGAWVRDYRQPKPPKPDPVPPPSPPPPPSRIQRKAGSKTAFFSGPLAPFIEALREFCDCPKSAEPSPVVFWPEERPGVVAGRVLPVRDRREWAEANEGAGEDEEYYEQPLTIQHGFPRRDR